MAGTVRDDWESFEAAVLPRDAGAIQRWEMRRAFYGGAWAMLCKVAALGEPEIGEAEGVDTLQRLTEECRAFANQIEKGLA